MRYALKRQRGIREWAPRIVSLWVDVDVPTCMHNQNNEADDERSEQQHPKSTEEPEQDEQAVSIVTP